MSDSFPVTEAERERQRHLYMQSREGRLAATRQADARTVAERRAPLDREQQRLNDGTVRGSAMALGARLNPANPELLESRERQLVGRAHYSDVRAELRGDERLAESPGFLVGDFVNPQTGNRKSLLLADKQATAYTPDTQNSTAYRDVQNEALAGIVSGASAGDPRAAAQAATAFVSNRQPAESTSEPNGKTPTQPDSEGTVDAPTPGRQTASPQESLPLTPTQRTRIGNSFEEWAERIISTPDEQLLNVMSGRGARWLINYRNEIRAARQTANLQEIELEQAQLTLREQQLRVGVLEDDPRLAASEAVANVATADRTNVDTEVAQQTKDTLVASLNNQNQEQAAISWANMTMGMPRAQAQAQLDEWKDANLIREEQHRALSLANNTTQRVLDSQIATDWFDRMSENQVLEIESIIRQNTANASLTEEQGQTETESRTARIEILKEQRRNLEADRGLTKEEANRAIALTALAYAERDYTDEQSKDIRETRDERTDVLIQQAAALLAEAGLKDASALLTHAQEESVRKQTTRDEKSHEHVIANLVAQTESLDAQTILTGANTKNVREQTESLRLQNLEVSRILGVKEEMNYVEEFLTNELKIQGYEVDQAEGLAALYTAQALTQGGLNALYEQQVASMIHNDWLNEVKLLLDDERAYAALMAEAATDPALADQVRAAETIISIVAALEESGTDLTQIGDDFDITKLTGTQATLFNVMGVLLDGLGFDMVTGEHNPQVLLQLRSRAAAVPQNRDGSPAVTGTNTDAPVNDTVRGVLGTGGGISGVRDESEFRSAADFLNDTRPDGATDTSGQGVGPGR